MHAKYDHHATRGFCVAALVQPAHGHHGYMAIGTFAAKLRAW
jgi:hypothetical protein